MKNLKRNIDGITLIALVISIIVLLILAGVSIAMLTGENGILNRATEASKKTNEAKDEEQRQFAMAEAAMNFENTEYEDENGEKVTVPIGFSISGVEGENTVKDGLVIVDSNGNEFVWIPCKNIEEYENIIEDDSWGEYEYSSKEDVIWTDGEQTELAKNSIINYGGFYVGRYEAGVPSNAPFYVSNSSENKQYTKEELKNDDNLISNLKPVSKKGNQVWNFISQKNAEMVSKNMYEENSSISSYLVDSKSWNYICKYIFNAKLKKNVTNAIELGNYRLTNNSHYLNINGLYAIHYYKDGDWEYAHNYKYGKIQSDELPGKDRSISRTSNWGM